MVAADKARLQAAQHGALGQSAAVGVEAEPDQGRVLLVEQMDLLRLLRRCG